MQKCTVSGREGGFGGSTAQKYLVPGTPTGGQRKTPETSAASRHANWRPAKNAENVGCESALQLATSEKRRKRRPRVSTPPARKTVPGWQVPGNCTTPARKTPKRWQVPPRGWRESGRDGPGKRPSRPLCTGRHRLALQEGDEGGDVEVVAAGAGEAGAVGARTK